jgi:hypothetical protein
MNCSHLHDFFRILLSENDARAGPTLSETLYVGGDSTSFPRLRGKDSLPSSLIAPKKLLEKDW